MGCGTSSSAKACAPTALEGDENKAEGTAVEAGSQQDPVPTTDAAAAANVKRDDAGAAAMQAASEPTSPACGAKYNNASLVVAADPLEQAARHAKQVFDARQQRLEAGTETMNVECRQEPLYTKIGHRDPRHIREQWKAALEAPSTLKLEPRIAENDIRILFGKMDESTRIDVLHDTKRIVCLSLSSTFTDTENERNLLIADVVPYLQDYARKYNFDFRLVEMRWGIRAEASNAHQTSEICMAELERCQRDSQGFSYVFLGCQKYGFRPFPAKISKDVFEYLRREMPAEDQELVDRCFLLDTNVYEAKVPAFAGDTKGSSTNGIKAGALNEWHYGAADSVAGPVYVLQSSGQFKDWWPMFERMQVAFRKAARQLWPEKEDLLRDPRSQAFLKKFSISVTEEEFSRGLLWLSEEDQRKKTLVFRRTIDDLGSHVGDEEGKPWLFMDVKDGALDTEAQTLLQQQLEMVPAHVETIAYDTIQWGPGVDLCNPEHQLYLRKFLDDFTTKMIDSIRTGAQKLAVQPDAVVDEAAQHLRFALVRADKFTPTTSTHKVEVAAENYLRPGADTGTALVIYGRSGAGKTYLLSQIMARCLDAPAAGGCVVIRFLGTTPRSSNVHALLTSLCEQLRRVYGKEGEVPSEFQDLRAYFAAAVKEWPSMEQPLTLFIDSVDQLDDSNGGRRLEWLPVTGLPPHVKLVVSTLPDYPEFRCLSILESKLENEVDSQLVEVETISEPEKVLMHLLHLQGRTLTDRQRQHVLDVFDKRKDNDAAGTPLWLTIVAQAVSAWTSYDDVLFPIASAVRDLITDLFDRLVVDHGEALVHAALGYITLAEDGVSETELIQLLSLDDDVLESSYQWWVPPVRIVPPLLVTRLLSDLAPYLTRRGDGSGAELVSWYHRQFWEAARAWLFGSWDMARELVLKKQAMHSVRQKRHLQLADFFGGRWAGVSKPYSDPKGLKWANAGSTKPSQGIALEHPRLAAALEAEKGGEERKEVHFKEDKWRQLQVPRLPCDSFIQVGETYFEPADGLKKCVQRFFKGEKAADRQVSTQPLVLDGDLFDPDQPYKINTRRANEFVHHLIGSRQIDRAVQELTSPEYIAVKFALGDGAVLMHEYAEAVRVFATYILHHPHAAEAADTLRKCKATVGAFLKILEQRPPIMALQMCSQQPDQHPLCLAAKAYLAGRRLGPANAARTVTWINKRQELDPCQLEMKEHSDDVNSVAYFPNGDRLASASDDGTVRVFSTVSGEVLLELQGHKGKVECVTVSPDGEKLASGGAGDKTVKVWDAKTGKCESTVDCGEGVSSLDFSPCGFKIAAACGNDVKILNSSSESESAGTFKCQSTLGGRGAFGVGGHSQYNGECTCSHGTRPGHYRRDRGCPMTGHSFLVESVCWSPDGRWIASGSRDNSAKVWDASTGKCRWTVTVDSGVLCVSFAPNGEIIAAGDEAGDIHFFDARTAAKSKPSISGHSDWVESVCFSSDGKLVASGSRDNSAKVWDASTGACQSTLNGHSDHVRCLAWSKGGKMLASGSDDWTIKIWDPISGACESSSRGHKAKVNCVVFAPDSMSVASCSGEHGKNDNTIKIWSSGPSGKYECHSTLAGHSGWVTQVEFLDADTVVSNDGTTRAWDIATGAHKSEFEAEKFNFTRSNGTRQRVGQYVVTKEDDLVLVQLMHAVNGKETVEDLEEKSRTVAFFRAPGVVTALECAGDRIAVGCQSGDVLHLQAPWLVQEA